MGPYRVEHDQGDGWVQATIREWPDGYDLDTLQNSLIAELESQGLTLKKKTPHSYQWTMTFKPKTGAKSVEYRILQNDGTPA